MVDAELKARVEGALIAIGCDRVIWIDDHFNDSPGELARLLWRHKEEALPTGEERADNALRLSEELQDEAEGRLTELLGGLTATRRAELKDGLLARVQRDDGTPTKEFTSRQVETACVLLGVQPPDRWTFQDAESRAAAVCGEGDNKVTFIVDLKDAQDGTDRGIEVLLTLEERSSRANVFVLTHEAALGGEAAREAELRSDLAARGQTGEATDLRFCVVSKQGLTPSPANPSVVADGLVVAIKRSGLRRSMHQVLTLARDCVHTAFEDARAKLLDVGPEQLERFMVRRSFDEGVSELHVVERALTSHVGAALRSLFAEPYTQADMRRLRALRSVELPAVASATSEALEQFRRNELWEDGDLINRSLSPVFPGDVFELDDGGGAAGEPVKRFVLLGAACDVQLRANGKRARASGWLVRLLEKAPGEVSGGAQQLGGEPPVPSALSKTAEPEQDDKPEMKLKLPFRMGGREMVCDFHGSSEVRLSVLDLASFREDGRVRFETGHAKPSSLLPGLDEIFARRIKAAAEFLAGSPVQSNNASKPKAIQANAASQSTFVPELQLTFRADPPFNRVHYATLEQANDGAPMLPGQPRPAWVTWRLRRCGRLRSPYPEYILDKLLYIQGRYGFDIDYTFDKP